MERKAANKIQVFRQERFLKPEHPVVRQRPPDAAGRLKMDQEKMKSDAKAFESKARGIDESKADSTLAGSTKSDEQPKGN